MSAFRGNRLSELVGHLASGHPYGDYGPVYWGFGRDSVDLVTFLRLWYPSALSTLLAHLGTTRRGGFPMDGDVTLFYPYKSYGQFNSHECDEEFSIEALGENLELGCRTVRTPEGSTAYICNVVSEGKSTWQILFPTTDVSLFLEYFSLETFWPHCDEIMRSLNQSRESKLLYSAQQRKFIGMATRPGAATR